MHVLFVVLLSVISSVSLAQGTVLPIAQFETEDLNTWQAKSFAGHTQYDIVMQGDKKVLKATSQASASGIAKEIKIDLKQTPYLNWSWKVDVALEGLDETSKQGDDYAARLYVVKSGGWKIWNTLALNYVWSSNQQAGAMWDNAFAGDNARMFAIKDKSHMTQWQTEKRNVYEDMIKLFGDKGSDEANEEAYRFIDAVAIMTDADNSERNTEALYGDIYFSDK